MLWLASFSPLYALSPSYHNPTGLVQRKGRRHVSSSKNNIAITRAV